MYRASITVKKDINNLYRALKPEENQDKRASLKISKKKDKIEIIVTAQDAVSLRAMLASVTRLLAVYEKS